MSTWSNLSAFLSALGIFLRADALYRNCKKECLKYFFNSNCFSLTNTGFSVHFSNVPEDWMVFKLLAKLSIKAKKCMMKNNHLRLSNKIIPLCPSNKLPEK